MYTAIIIVMAGLVIFELWDDRRYYYRQWKTYETNYTRMIYNQHRN